MNEPNTSDCDLSGDPQATTEDRSTETEREGSFVFLSSPVADDSKEGSKVIFFRVSTLLLSYFLMVPREGRLDPPLKLSRL